MKNAGVESAEAEMSSDNSTTYIVQRGDTLAGVALRLGVTKSELKRANHMFGTISLITGQQLVVHPKGAGEGTRSDREDSGDHHNDHKPAMSIMPATAATTASVAAGAAAEKFGKETGTGTAAPPTLGHANPDEDEKSLDPRLRDRGAGGVPEEGAEGMLFTPSHWGGETEGAHAAAPRLSNVSTTSATGSSSGSFRGMVRSMFNTSGSSVAAPIGARGGIANTDGAKADHHSSSSSSTVAKLTGRIFGAGNTSTAVATKGSNGSSPTTDNGRKSREVSFSPLSTEHSPVPPPAAAGGVETNNGTPNKASSSSSSNQNQQDNCSDFDEDEELDRTRAASTAQLMLQYVKPSYWGLGGGGAAAAVNAPVAAMPVEDDLHGDHPVGAEGPEDGESEAANDRRRSRSFMEEDGRDSRQASSVVAQVMSRHAEAPYGYGHGDISELNSVPPVTPSKAELVLPGLVAGASTIVTHATLARMELALPKHFRGYKWYLLYSSFRDGANWLQFYNRIKGEVPTYVMIENMEGEVFGGFAASAWSSTSKYYGTGESFLFSMRRTTPPPEAESAFNNNNNNDDDGAQKEAEQQSAAATTETETRDTSSSKRLSTQASSDSNDMACFSRGTYEDDMASAESEARSRSMSPPVPARKTNNAVSEAWTGIRRDDEDEGQGGGGAGAGKILVEGEVTTHAWTGMNMYFQYSDDVGIGMGGGGGSFGLFLGEDLLTGTTGKCDTFDNPPLCSKEAFDVSQVEVWGFTTASTEMGAKMERLRKTLRGKTTRPL